MRGLKPTSPAVSRRERVLCSLRHEVPASVPAYVNNVVDWEQYTEPLEVGSREALLDALGNSIISYVPEHVTIRDEDHELPAMFSIWGVPEELCVTYTDSIPRPLANAETIADVDAFSWPSARDWDFEPMRESLSEEHEHARMSCRWEPVFSRLCEMFGMEQAMVNLYTNLPVIEAALAQIENYYDQYYELLLDKCGDQLEIFAIGDDFACNTGLFIPPALWRKLLKPLYKKWLAMAKRRGLFTLMHSCGRVIEVLPDLIDIGLDAWETVQTHLPGQGARKLKETFGRYLTFVGGIDTTNILGLLRPKQVKDHVLKQMELLGKNGGYICAPDHTIMAEVPAENVLTLYRTCSEFRRDKYTL